jgi:poly(3-hydroxybutyrate) depolymerase
MSGIGRRVAVLSVLFAAASFAGCGDDDPAGTGGAGGSPPGGGGSGGDGPPQKPEDVPAVAIVADPATACPAAFQGGAPAAGNNGGFDVAGQTRSFHLILPDATFEGPRPLFVAFNGTGETGPSFSARAELEDFAAKGFVVVAPSSAGNGTIWPVWDSMHAPGEDSADNKDLAFLDQLIQCTAAHYPIDGNRLYLGGHSAGGIMANYVLQRRSDVFAGGIVASGVFSLTAPVMPAPLEPTFVLVTWGGDNDAYSGGSNGVSVPEINFVEQASIATQFYEAEPNVGQANCHGDDFGHAWLDVVNGWMADQLLLHPKGLPGSGELSVDAAPGPGVTCSAEPYAFEGGLTVICPSSATEGCQTACQLFADCAVENATVGPILAPQLSDLGFSGSDNTDCTGCITHCEANATQAADASVLACITDFSATATCGPGIDGALPAIDAINECCAGQAASPYCVEVCTVLLENSATTSFLPACVELVD